jgi:hypothetical protein
MHPILTIDVLYMYQDGEKFFLGGAYRGSIAIVLKGRAITD